MTLHKMRTEKVFALPYRQAFPPSVTHVERLIHFPVPRAAAISASFRTPVLRVCHEFIIKVRLCATGGAESADQEAAPGTGRIRGGLERVARALRRPFASMIRLRLPVVVGGFPCTI